MKRMLVVIWMLTGAGCPLSHGPYDTSRACSTDQDCPKSEVCTRPDAGVGDAGPGLFSCYDKSSIKLCRFGDAGVSFYCFNPEYECYHILRHCVRYDWDAGCVQWQPEKYGCAPGTLGGAP